MRRGLLLLLAPALLAGCVASPARRAADAGVGTPADWSTAQAVAGSPIAAAWWTDFGDPRLDELIAAALVHNRDLRAAAARVEQAAAMARIAGADLKPSAGASFDAARRRQVFIGFPIPGVEVPSSTSTSLGPGVSVSWEVDLWGRLRAGARAAVADLEATALEHEGARLSIAALTARGWFAVVEAGRQLELARATAESFRTSAEQVRSRYVSGVRPSLDLRLALSNQAQAEALVAARREQLDRAVRRLEVLVGSYPAGAIAPAPGLPDTPRPIAAGLPADLVARRPDLAAAERRLAAADARVAQARRALYPRISLTAGGGTASNELKDLLDGDFRVWNLVANLAQPLFQGGRLRANVDRNRAVGDEAVARYAALALTAYAEVESALAAEQSLAERETHLRRAVDQARAAERLALDRYRSGLESYITVLEAQNRALSAESEWLSVRRARLDNRVDLFVALGGGFEREGSS